MAKLSLQEQLLKSGLVGAGQARAAKSEKHKQTKQQQHNKAATVNDSKEQAQNTRLEQAERDRELNQLRKLEEERKQLAAQVKQIVEQHRLPKEDNDDIAYHFTDNNKVKTLYISATIREKLTQGKLAVVKLDKRYEIVPIETAEKIKVRDQSSIIVMNKTNDGVASTHDPYADYAVPDDLMW